MTTYDSATLDDIAMRLSKGWKIRVDEMETLLRMARELLDIKQAPAPPPPSFVEQFMKWQQGNQQLAPASTP